MVLRNIGTLFDKVFTLMYMYGFHYGISIYIYLIHPSCSTLLSVALIKT